MPKILITGASGFVGKSLTAQLLRQGHSVRAAVRSRATAIEGAEALVVGDINGDTDWAETLNDVDVIIHLAARVHVVTEHSVNPLTEFRKVNMDGTRRLADFAAKTGVKRLVYVSSIGVNGSEALFPFNELDGPNPKNDYAVSKWEAEQALHKVAAETILEVVIIRPPLVYGFGAPGNFAQMTKVLAKGIPLPFASVRNQRSLIYIENLVDALILCSTHPNAAGQTYLVSDGQDISTPDLLRKLSNAMRKPVKLLPCSPTFIRLAGRLFGKLEQVDRLLGSLQVDSSKIRRELGWQPPFTLDKGLKATVSSQK
jgi:nucleoside-diphosphate-sugar epimerase